MPGAVLCLMIRLRTPRRSCVQATWLQSRELGGYHLAVDATNEAAVVTLRARKHREAVCPCGAASQRRPPAGGTRVRGGAAPHQPSTTDRPLAPPGSRPGRSRYGAREPLPGHHAAVHAAPSPAHPQLNAPIVLTSGNVSDEPIAYQDAEALERLHGIADAFLTHDRPIAIRTDDSIVRSWRGTPMLLRRSRGYTPEPVSVPWEFPQPVLACGAELKNTICVAKGQYAFLSHHIGDLENFAAFQSFRKRSPTSSACSTCGPRSWRTISIPGTYLPNGRWSKKR